VNHRAAITEPKELGALLRAIEGYSGQPTTRLALQLSALLFVRPGELRHTRWSEIDFGKAVWTVPAETMKMKRPHRVPLSGQAIVIFRELHGMTGQGEYVFPAVDSFRRPMSNNTQQHPECGTAPAGLRKGRDQRVGFSDDRLDAAQRDGAMRTRSSGSWRTWRRTTFVWADYLDQLQHGSSAYQGIRPFARSQG
jgi:integrase